jgi:hypothetical protein
VSGAGVPSVHTGDLRSTTVVVPQPVLTQQKMVGDLAGKAVVWDVYTTTVATSDNTVVSASSQEVALDRVSGAAAPWNGAWSNSTDAAKGSEPKVAFKGWSYKFPFGAEKKSYDFWDDTLGKTLPINFKSVETVQGLQAYRYEQVVPLQEAPLDSTTEAVLSGTFGDGTGGKLFYGNTRTLWVDPVTGTFLNVREQRHLEFRAANGPTTTLLEADFSYDDATLKSTATTVKDNLAKLTLVSVILPIGLLVLGLLLIIGGFLLMRRGSEHHDDADDDHAARHLVEV